jgi:ABC-2 type transport system ATP-binding protein
MLAREKDMAVIVSSHLLSEMEMMCDRIGIIQKGKLIDVQLISDFVQGAGKVYEIEVDEKEQASFIISKLISNDMVELTEKGVSIPLKREAVPQVVNELVAKGIKIYGIKEMTKTLEERFLEVTSKEVHEHV